MTAIERVTRASAASIGRAIASGMPTSILSLPAVQDDRLLSLGLELGLELDRVLLPRRLGGAAVRAAGRSTVTSNHRRQGAGS